MHKPVIFALHDDPNDLSAIEQELRERYAAHYSIVCEGSPQAGLEKIKALQNSGDQVAVLLADLWLAEITGVEFLEQCHNFFPDAKRVLIIHPGDFSANHLLFQAMSLNQVDNWMPIPLTSPDERFHRLITGFLEEWSRLHRQKFEMVKIVDKRWSPRSHELRDLLGRYNIPYGFYESESPQGQEILDQTGTSNGPFPVILLFNGRVFTDPSTIELAEQLGASSEPDIHNMLEGKVFDIAIVGAGPAGLSAAVYGASEGLSTFVIEREAIGGQAGTSSMIRNYLGFPTGISGGELSSRAYNQAVLFGASFYLVREANSLRAEGNNRVLKFSDGNEIVSRTVLLAGGVTYRRLEIPGLEALCGRGVFYGAAATEAPAMTGGRVFVVGGGNSSGQAAVHLAKYAEHLTVVVRGSSLENTMSEYLIKEIHLAKNITVRTNTEIVDGGGSERLEWLRLKDMKTGKEQKLPALGLFVLIGAIPHTGWLPPEIIKNDSGYIYTGEELLKDGMPPRGWPLKRLPLMLETSMPGVFAAGDMRYRSIKRVASAVGEGSIAIHLIHQYLNEKT